MSLAKLRAQAAAIELSSDTPYDREGHKKFYTYWDSRFEPGNTELAQEEWPPLDLIVYTLRSKLYPTIIQIQIPDILKLLAWVEQYRSAAWKKAVVALELNKTFKESEPHLALNAEQENSLRDLTPDTRDRSLRELYLAILSDFCHLEMYSLWATENFPLLPIRLAENFPSIHSSSLQDGLSPMIPEYPVFYDDFTREEKEVHATNGRRCIAAIEQTVSGSITPEDLLSEFENQDQEGLLEDVELFIAEVSQLVQVLEEIFPMEDDG